MTLLYVAPFRSWLLTTAPLSALTVIKVDRSRLSTTASLSALAVTADDRSRWLTTAPLSALTVVKVGRSRSSTTAPLSALAVARVDRGRCKSMVDDRSRSSTTAPLSALTVDFSVFRLSPREILVTLFFPESCHLVAPWHVSPVSQLADFGHICKCHSGQSPIVGFSRDPG